jgi:DNA-binding LacI/PurR family transcriptional regulator
MRVTLEDIAIELNLSHPTVSRCLHDHPRHSAATIARVKATAQRLGYQPPK